MMIDTKELPIRGGQRLHSEEECEQMAEEAIITVKHSKYSLILAAVKTYHKAVKQLERAGQRDVYYPSAVCFWAGFLEGVRTQKQKDKRKAARHSTSSGKANIKHTH